MLHEDRGRAASFGDDAEQYDRSRPTYPAAMVDDLVEQFRPHEPDGRLRVLDVGCGTGIVARQFLERDSTVIGVEVDARMAAVSQRHGIDVDVAPFETWVPRGGPFDLVVSGQAWHWVDPQIGPWKAAEVLRSGGALAAFWHDYRYEPVFHAATVAVYRELAPELVESSMGLGTIPAATIAENRRADIAALGACGLFGGTTERTYTTGRQCTRDVWLNELATHSSHRVADPAMLEALFGQLADVVDRFGGSVEIELSTTLLLATRR